MSKLVLGYVKATGIFLVALNPDTLPATYGDPATPVTALGNIDHTPVADGLPGHEHDVSHTIFHHVREVLYKRSAANPALTALFPDNITDMASIKIMRHGPLISAEGLKATDLVIVVGATAPIVTKYLPTGTVAVANKLTYVSSNPAVATVNASGVVTAVAPGTATISATVTGLTLTTNVGIKVNAA